VGERRTTLPPGTTPKIRKGRISFSATLQNRQYGAGWRRSDGGLLCIVDDAMVWLWPKYPRMAFGVRGCPRWAPGVVLTAGKSLMSWFSKTEPHVHSDRPGAVFLLGMTAGRAIPWFTEVCLLVDVRSRETAFMERSQIMGRSVRSTATTTQWAETITAKVQTIAAQLGLKKHKLTDINSATPELLRSLIGIGSLYAEKIVEGRPYQRTDELVTKHVLPQVTYDRLKGQIVVKLS